MSVFQQKIFALTGAKNMKNMKIKKHDFSSANFAGKTHFARTPRTKWEKNFAARPQLRAKISYDFSQQFSKKRSFFFARSNSKFWGGGCLYTCVGQPWNFLCLRVWGKGNNMKTCKCCCSCIFKKVRKKSKFCEDIAFLLNSEVSMICKDFSPKLFNFSTKKIINQRRKRIFFVKNYNFCRKNENFRTFLVKK